MKGQSFFFMGCWNEDRCDAVDYRAAVIQQILKDQTTHKYAFGVIAGDNIYQQRGTYHLKTLDYGFGLLQKTKVPLYTLLGNHDVHKKLILQAHLDLVEKHKIVMPRHCYTVTYPNMRMIVLDTNLLTGKKSKDNTYAQLLNDYPAFFSIPTATDLLNYLETELNKPFAGWTLVVGHEPFVSINLNAAGRVKVSHLNHYERLTGLLSASPRTLYLCADIHAFQAMNVPVPVTSPIPTLTPTLTPTIPLVVVGTGGAFPDRIPDESIPIPLPAASSSASASRRSVSLRSATAAAASASARASSVSLRSSAPARPTFKIEGTSPSYGYVSVTYTATQLQVHFHPLKGCSDGQSEMTFEYRDGRLVLIQRMPVAVQACPARPAGGNVCSVQKEKNT